MSTRWHALAGIAAIVFAAGNASAAQGLACGGPLKGWLTPKDKMVHVQGGLIEVSLRSDGTIFWNGLRVNDRKFSALLKRGANEVPQAIILLEPNEHVDCTILGAVRTQIHETFRCSSDGICGEGKGFPY